MAHTVDGNQRKAVGHGMTALHGGPCLALPLLFVGSVAALIADGCGVDQQFGSLQRHQPGSLRIPLVPADEHAQTAHRGLYGGEAQVAGGEIEFLVVGRVVGDVHLAILAGNAAVALQHHRGVVIQSRCAPLEQRGDDDHIQPLGQLAEEGGRLTGYRLCQVEVVHILHLTEVERVVQFLQHNQFGAPLSQVADTLCQPVHVARLVGSIMLLYDSYFHDSPTNIRKTLLYSRFFSKKCFPVVLFPSCDDAPRGRSVCRCLTVAVASCSSVCCRAA